MRRLLLARHGQSVSNAIRRFQGAQDVALSPLGMRQAEALGQAVSRRAIAHVYVSPFERARHTAEIALAGLGLPLTVVDDLRELSLGEWEGCTVEEIRTQPGDPYARWVRDPVQCLPPGGEPLADVQARVVQAVERIAAAHPNGDDVLIVSHGGVISALLPMLRPAAGFDRGSRSPTARSPRLAPPGGLGERDRPPARHRRSRLRSRVSP